MCRKKASKAPVLSFSTCTKFFKQFPVKIPRKVGRKEAKGLLCKVEFPTSSPVNTKLFPIWLAFPVGWFQLHHQPHLRLSDLKRAEQGDLQKLKKSHFQGIQDLIRGQVVAQGLYNSLEEG